MYSFEIPKKRGYPRTVFYDDGFVFYYKNGGEVKIAIDDIDRIEYVKPSFWNYLGAGLFPGGSTYPGRMEIYLKDSAGDSIMNKTARSKLYLVKISYNDIFKLPEPFKTKMGVGL